MSGATEVFFSPSLISIYFQVPERPATQKEVPVLLSNDQNLGGQAAWGRGQEHDVKGGGEDSQLHLCSEDRLQEHGGVDQVQFCHIDWESEHLCWKQVVQNPPEERLIFIAET